METETNFFIILARIENYLVKIDELLDKIEHGCGKMQEHIQFVETTYELVRSPLNYIKNRFEYAIGNNNNELPKITKNGEEK